MFCVLDASVVLKSIKALSMVGQLRFKPILFTLDIAFILLQILQRLHNWTKELHQK